MKLSEIVISHAKEIMLNHPYEHIRFGQALVISLHSIYYDKYVEICGNDEVDCFYLDRNIDNFIKFLDGGN
jgi:hypothetical protein